MARPRCELRRRSCTAHHKGSGRRVEDPQICRRSQGTRRSGRRLERSTAPSPAQKKLPWCGLLRSIGNPRQCRALSHGSPRAFGLLVWIRSTTAAGRLPPTKSTHHLKAEQNILIRDSEEFSTSFLQTFLQLVILVLIPFLAGIYTLINKPTLAEKLSGRLDRFLKVVVLVLTFSGPIEIRELLLDNFFEGFKLAFLALIAIYLLNVVGSKTLNLSNKNSQTITIEGLCQNFPIVLVLAATLNMPELIVFGVIYYLISTAFAVSYAFLKNI